MGINESLLTYEQQAEEIERLRAALHNAENNCSNLRKPCGVYECAWALRGALRADKRAYLASSWSIGFSDISLHANMILPAWAQPE